MSSKEPPRRRNLVGLGLTITLGESINVPCGELGVAVREAVKNHTRSASEPTTAGDGSGPASYISKLPAAVAHVPPEDKKAYLHQKKVGGSRGYMIGQTLGEGSFAKVKEAFHPLVGEKVSTRAVRGGMCNPGTRCYEGEGLGCS